MWAVIPRLQRQPDVAMFPDHPDRVGMPGFGGGPFGVLRTSYSFTGSVGETATLTSLVPNVCAVHTMLRFLPNTSIVIKLGTTYGLRLTNLTRDVTANWALGDSGTLISKNFNIATYGKADLLENNNVISSTLLPSVDYANSFQQPDVSGIVACFGYAYSDSGQLLAYAHISTHRVARAQQVQNGIVPSCGSGTASLRIDADPALAFDGPFTFTGSSGVEFINMACRLDAFALSVPHAQDTLATRVARAGTRVASLRSNATNFSQPLAFGGQFIEGFRGNTQGMATVDCGAHNEFVNSSRFAVSLAGQPNADTAYVPASGSWQSNCGFTAAQVEKMSALTVDLNNLGFTANNPFGGFQPPVNISLTFGSVQSMGLGNNEYVGVANSPDENFEKFHVWVSVAGFEDVADYNATPLSAVQVTHRFVVTVSVYAEGEFWGDSTFRRLGSVTLSKTLNETEAIAFFDGGSITLGSGSVTLTPSG